MESYLYFFASVVAVTVISILVVFKTFSKAITYFKKNRAVFHGIIAFISAASLVGFIALLIFKTYPAAAEGIKTDKGKFLNYGHVFIGIDRTASVSNMCEPGKPNDRLTSNGGIEVNIYQSSDSKFDLNTVYTHHSCAFNTDTRHYDGIGLRATYKLW